MEKQLGWITLEQSKKLVEAGLDPNTADMHIINWRTEKEGYFDTSLCYSKWDAEHVRGYLPCWSLGRLIELMPFNPTINGIKVFFQLNQIGCRYIYKDDDLSIREIIAFTNSNLIDNVVSMVCWLLENNHIKKGETK